MKKLRYLKTISGGTLTKKTLYFRTVNEPAIQIGTNDSPRIVTESGKYAIDIRTQYSGATGYGINLYLKAQSTGTGTANIHNIIVHAETMGVQSTATAAQNIESLLGRVLVSGTVDNTGLFITGIHAQIMDGGTWTHASHVSALWADWHLNKDSSAVDSSELLYLSNNTGTPSYSPDNAIYLSGANVENFVYFSGCDNGEMVLDTGESAATSKGKIRISVNGATRYLRYYT